ncbi:MAG: tRNA (N6-isopentenyl adenosine(37)-C2)-methylthiotransferase MiaB [Actinobacteria bacterium]|nr:tRNA (N6-isopentenyl adenosine(37)-C2)-methylthiotransferase MiaB [Actinomycetota bacterium]
MSQAPQVFIETYGCQMNVYDTQLIESILKSNQFELTTDENSADVVMLNTCSVRENANRKIYQRVQGLRAHQTRRPLIGVLGCMATNFRKKLLDDDRLDIDFIAGPDSYKQLPQLIQQAGKGKQVFHVTLSEFETYSDVYPTRDTGANAWIAVMRGCNNYCTFCVVPFTRGRERSRSVGNVIEEVERLVSEGITQVTLLGQNVNSYKEGDHDFTDLMAAVSDVKGVKRIRFTSPHPKDFPTKLLTLMAQRPNICNQIHLPLQAGNDRVLEKMNRTYTKQEFLDLASHIREVIPDVVMTTDIIVGFPTESDDEFMDTMDVVQQVQFDSAFTFKYSERQYTLASKRFPDLIPEAIKTERIVRLVDAQRAISLSKNIAHVGEVQKVMIERTKTKKSDDEYLARNEGNKMVIIPSGTGQVGDYLDVNIVEATSSVLKGVVV